MVKFSVYLNKRVFVMRKRNSVFTLDDLAQIFIFLRSMILHFVTLDDLAQIIFFVTKTRLYNSDPRKPHFYIVKLGFTGVYIIFLLFSAQNIDRGYSLEPPPRGGSNEYPRSMF